MKTLVVGQGGREHALAWKLAQSPEVTRTFVAPGNAGTALDADTENVDIAATDVEGIVAFAKREKIDLTVVGPEAPLVAGLVDRMRDEKLRVFGPTKKAARLEGSKVFCKEVLRAAGVPTAEARTFDDPDDAIGYLKNRPTQDCVIKADGLAAGKGVFVCDTTSDAIFAVNTILEGRAFGEAGARVLVEDRLTGPEVSVLALTDGKAIVPLASSQDHKAARDGDEGPNTGGMGAYSPTPFATDAVMDTVFDKVLIPTVHEMNRRRTPFRGVLYAGLMLTPTGPKVLEYNVRFGDPEAQPVLMRLKSDLFELLAAVADGKLADFPELEWDDRPGVCVVMASEGYPGDYAKGRPIRGLDAEPANAPDVKVFHAGTRPEGDAVLTDGGRVLGVTALGDDLSDAKRRAYEAVRPIRWDGAWCRKDISDKAR